MSNSTMNVLISIREKNFSICKERNWSVEEEHNHLNLYDENNKIVDRFYGHIALNEFLNR